MATAIKMHDDGAEPTTTTSSTAAGPAQMTPQQVRNIRDRSPTGELPPELRISVADAIEREAQMTPQQIAAHRDAHGGLSPVDLARAGGAL